MDQQRYKHIHYEIEIYCLKIGDLLAGNRVREIELVNIKSLKDDWYGITKHYEAHIQEGYCTNSAFQNAKKAAEQIFHVQFLGNLQKDDLSSWQLLETYLKQLKIHLETVELDLTKKDPKRPFLVELDDSKWTMLAIFILQFQAAIGVFMTVLSLARFVSLFPQPASTDIKEQEANEVRHTKLLEEINQLKETVEKNSVRITDNEREIDKIQRESERNIHSVI